MSNDLISRSVLTEEIKSFYTRITGSANAMALMIVEECKKSIINMVEEQPTAYDVDKVADRMEDYLFEKYCVEGDTEVEKIIKGGG